MGYTCLNCNAAWSTSDYDNICPGCGSCRCEDCGGSGVSRSEADPGDIVDSYIIACASCGGSGAN